MKNLILFLLLFIPSLALAQVEITTKSGDVHRGIITFIDQDSLILKELSGTKISIQHHQISQQQNCITEIRTMPHDIQFKGALVNFDDSTYSLLTYLRDTVTLQKSKVGSIKIKTVNGSPHYPLIGLSFFMPGGLNAVLGYQFDFGFGIRLSGGTLGKKYGYQANILFNTLKTRHVESNISIGGGQTDLNFGKLSSSEDVLSPRFYYVGAFIDVNIFGVYLESQMILALDGSRTVLTGLSLGYVFRFN